MHKPAEFPSSDGAQARIEEQLHDTIDTLRTDMSRVELWAYALAGFTKPVPGYDADENFRLRRKPDLPQ